MINKNKNDLNIVTVNQLVDVLATTLNFFDNKNDLSLDDCIKRVNDALKMLRDDAKKSRKLKPFLRDMLLGLSAFVVALAIIFVVGVITMGLGFGAKVVRDAISVACLLGVSLITKGLDHLYNPLKSNQKDLRDHFFSLKNNSSLENSALSQELMKKST